VLGYVAIITETESTHVMIESTLRFDDVEDITMPSLASAGGSKVTYAVKRTEREKALEQG